MATIGKPLEVHLIGSSPFASASEYLTTVAQALPKQLHRLSDGETGIRANFIGWQHSTLPITIIQPRFGGQPSPESAAKTYTLSDIKPTGYDDQAIQSYAIFRSLKGKGTISQHVRFQVCLPTPLSVARGFVEDDGVCAQVEPLYETRLLEALRKIQEVIPASELTIQWDLPTEIAALEYERGRTQDRYWKPYFAPVKLGLLQRLARLAGSVEPEVEMGYHLCYGDLGHVHFVQPEDMGLMVDLANLISERVKPVHKIDYIHMPVPKDRVDDAYFKPMEQLRLGEATKLFLGVVHPGDESGTKARLEAAVKVFPHVTGVSSECGFGRTPMEDVQSMLNICKSVTDQ